MKWITNEELLQHIGNAPLCSVGTDMGWKSQKERMCVCV